MNMLRRTTTLALLLWSACGFAQINYENKTRLTDDWLFLRQDLGNVWEAVRPFSAGSPEAVPLWGKVTLPHCFNAEDAVDPDVNYYQGPGWYKTLITIDNPYSNGRTILHFEGAGQKSSVYIYTERVATHVGGYDEWQVDITDAVKRFLLSGNARRFDGKVPLVIRCDNSRDTEMIPSDLSDFNLYGGLYRYLNLVYVPAIAFESVFTRASVDVGGKRGELTIEVALKSYVSTNDLRVSARVFNPKGKLVKEFSRLLEENLPLTFTTEIARPLLWSPDAPNLYSCELTLHSLAGTMVCREKFGFRHAEFVENGPFLLNGKRLLLRGTHRHEDHAGVGAAMTEEMIVREMELMKSMGVNFIRLGHYQQSRIVLEQCDRLGILVWEEIPWCRGGLGGEIYQEQARRVLTNMITQHRNHPSVILWGLGNENDWPNDFPVFDREAIRTFMRELHELSHRLDSSRLTAIRRCDFCKDIVDVYSPSIWAGWYRGLYTDYKEVTRAEMQKVPRFLHAEWGGDSHAHRHAENSYASLSEVDGGGGAADERAGDASLYGGIARASKDGDWSETYICDLIDWHLKEQEDMEWLTGSAYWPFKDFSTPVRPENPIPYVNQKGVVERDLTPKESFYVFQSYWTERPMVRVYGHTWPIRWGDEEEKKIFKVYSNCEEVELFLNGTSLGIKRRDSRDFPAAGLRWETPLQAGKNVVRAVGWKGKKQERVEVLDEITFTYETRAPGKEAGIVVRMTDVDPEHAWVEAELVDRQGVVCVTSRKYIRFEAIGEGKLLVNRGTSTGSKRVQAINGRGKVLFEKGNGRSHIFISVDGLKSVFVEINR
jgi:beta-galactosidase